MSSEDIDHRIVKARAALITAHPFFGALALHLRPVPTTRYPRLATDGRNLFYNVEFLDTITADELKGIIAHEVYHCALKHHTRRKCRDRKEWNEAADLVINPMVLKAGLRLPTWVLLDPQYDGLSAEQVYRLRQQHRPPQEPENQAGSSWPTDNTSQPEGGSRNADTGSDRGEYPKPGDAPTDTAVDRGETVDEAPPEESFSEESHKAGGHDPKYADPQDDPEAGCDVPNDPHNPGADQNPETSDIGGHYHQAHDPSGEPLQSNDPNGCGEVLDAVPDADAGSLAEQEAEWDVRIRQAVNVAARAAGGVPGFLSPIVEQTKQAKHDWRAELRRFIDPSQRYDYSWSKPNRRFLSAGLILPGFVPDGVNHIAWIVDTSSSIDIDALAGAGAEAQAALDEGAVDKITIVYCDAAVQGVDTVLPGDLIQFTPVGRGGTRFAPASEWLKDNEPEISGAVYVTDLDVHSDDFGAEPMFPVLWAVYSDPQELARRMGNIPFGECVEITD